MTTLYQKIYLYRFEVLFSVVMMILMIEPAFASATTAMPWESPLKKVVNSLTGPTAMLVSIAGLFGTVAALIFGGELSDLIRKLVIAVLVISVLISASSFIKMLFGASSAVIS